MRTLTMRGKVNARGAFTIIELSVAVAIIALLAAILMFALRGVMVTARTTAERQLCISLKMGCEQFKQQFGFLPPVIEEAEEMPYQADDIGGGMAIVRDEGGNEGQQPRLRDVKAEAGMATPNFDKFKSVNTLAYYLVGAADKEIDGVDGPGFTMPIDKDRDGEEGHFLKRGQAYGALYDVTKDRTRLVRKGSQTDPRLLIVDRWGKALRYYRWEPSYYGQSEADRSLRGTVRKSGGQYLYNVPRVVVNSAGDPANVPELRQGGFAIMSSGPDGLFSDQSNPPNLEHDRDNIVEIGR